MTAQLPQNRPKVAKAATTGPPRPGIPARCGTRVRWSGRRRWRRPWPRRWLRPPAPGSPGRRRRGRRRRRSSRAADTVKVRRRPSTLTSVASARITLPTTDGGQVVELHPGGHAGLGGRQVPVGGPQRRFLAQGDEPGSGQNRDVAGAKVLGRVLVGDRQLHLGRETGVGCDARPDGVSSEEGTGTTITIPPVTDTSLIEPDVVERVLAAAFANGGEMAEVFAEDSTRPRGRCSTTAGSKSSPRVAPGAPASGSSSGRPPASPTRPI